MNPARLKEMFPHASAAFLAANASPQAVSAPPRPSDAQPNPSPLPARLRDPEPQYAPQNEPLAADQGKEKSQGRARVCIIRHATKLLDPDNLAGAKFLIDQLRYCGAIAGDSPEDIELELSQVRVASRKECGTEVIVEKR